MSWLDIIANNSLMWLGIFSGIFFVGSLVAVPLILVKIPADYFLEKKSDDARQHTSITGLFFKNLLGFIFLTMGIIMLFTPGQGILTILIGLSLLNFPGKRRLEINLIRRRKVQSAINWLRLKYNKAPLLIP